MNSRFFVPSCGAALLLTLSLLWPGNAAASFFGSDGPKDSDEITPVQYSGLLGLRDVDPVMFREKLLPMISEAMKDGRITVGELKDLEKAAGSVAQSFYKAAREPRLQDTFNEKLDEARKSGRELGSKLEDTLSNEVPKLFNDALDLFRDQMQQYKQENPEPATRL